MCRKFNHEEGCKNYSDFIPGYVFKLRVNPSNNNLACINESYKIYCIDGFCHFTEKKIKFQKPKLSA